MEKVEEEQKTKASPDWRSEMVAGRTRNMIGYWVGPKLDIWAGQECEIGTADVTVSSNMP